MKFYRQFIFSLCMVLLTIIPVISQDNIRIEKDYDQISLAALAEELNETHQLKVFFNTAGMDSVFLEDIKAGQSLESVLEQCQGLEGMNITYYGGSVFIYRGDPIVDKLPNFNSSEKAPANRRIPITATNGANSANGSHTRILVVGNGNKEGSRQKCQVRGRILNRENEGMIGATIFIREISLGTITDVDGYFRFSIRPGNYKMLVSHMAMKDVEYRLDVRSEGFLEIVLEDERIELEEVTVVDKRRDNVEGMMMGYERITSKSMKEIPVVLGERDVIQVARMLPGVQNVGEGSSGFNVRGGSADQNMFLINTISVYNTSHLFGFFTAFSPDIISDFSLYKNNIPSKYGGRIASVFEINTREGSDTRFYTQGGLSPITGHLMIEGPLVKEKVSYVASIRSTYSDWILGRIKDQDISDSQASFWDGSLGLNASINEKNKLKFFLYRSGDSFQFSGRNEYAYSNSGVSVRWKQEISDKFQADYSLSGSRYDFTNIDKNNVTEAYQQNYNLDQLNVRLDFCFVPSSSHRIDVGANSTYYMLNRGEIMPYGIESRRIPIDLGLEKGIENALYVSDEIQVLPRLAVLAGLRYTWYAYPGPGEVYHYSEGVPRSVYSINDVESFPSGETIKRYSGLEPRLAFNVRLAENTSIKGSYNRLRQYLFMLSNTIAISPTDQWKLTDYYLEPPVSDQVSVGLYQDFDREGISISMEVYRKWLHNIVEYKDGISFISGDPTETLTLQGNQDTKGVELMVKKNKGLFTGWVSYAYSRSMVTVDGPGEGFRINDGLPYPSNYDRPHSVNLVSTFRISKRISLSGNMVYITGRPLTVPVAVYYTEGQQYLYYSSRNKYRIPDYFRIDLSLNLEGNLRYKKIAHSYWMLNIYNATGRHNVYSVFYEARDGAIQGYKLSIFGQPIVSLSWNFKFGNYNNE